MAANTEQRKEAHGLRRSAVVTNPRILSGDFRAFCSSCVRPIANMEIRRRLLGVLRRNTAAAEKQSPHAQQNDRAWQGPLWSVGPQHMKIPGDRLFTRVIDRLHLRSAIFVEGTDKGNINCVEGEAYGERVRGQGANQSLSGSPGCQFPRLPGVISTRSAVYT